MAKNGRTVRGFAAEAQLDKMTVSRLLHGNFKRLTTDTIAKVSRATNAEISEASFAALLARMAA